VLTDATQRPLAALWRQLDHDGQPLRLRIVGALSDSIFQSELLMSDKNVVAPGVANFTFGGTQNNVLYMMADTAIWAAQIKAVGATRTQ
jgi:hypothetical protein